MRWPSSKMSVVIRNELTVLRARFTRSLGAGVYIHCVHTPLDFPRHILYDGFALGIQRCGEASDTARERASEREGGWVGGWEGGR